MAAMLNNVFKAEFPSAASIMVLISYIIVLFIN